MIRYFFLLVFLFVTFLDRAFATVGGSIDSDKLPAGVIDTPPGALVGKIITYAIGIAAILGVIGITWGGIQMILSVGEDEKLKKGRYIVIYSIIGVVVAGLAYSIVNLIGNIKL